MRITPEALLVLAEKIADDETITHEARLRSILPLVRNGLALVSRRAAREAAVKAFDDAAGSVPADSAGAEERTELDKVMP